MRTGASAAALVPGAGPDARTFGRVAAAALLLNFALSFNSVWPSLLIKPDARLAPELVAVWVLLILSVRRWGAVPARVIAMLAAGYAFLVVGRYADVTVPSVLGRDPHIYWDGAQVPRFLWVTARDHGAWTVAALAAAVLVGLVLLHVLLRAALGVLARDAAPRAARSPTALALTAAAAALCVLNALGHQWTWPYLSKPVTASLARQAVILRNAWSPDHLARALPPSPPLESDLASLRGMDVAVIMLESYGTVAFGNDAVRDALQGPRAGLVRSIEGSGRAVVSAFVRSPTFGGASDLAHLGMLSGIDLSDPLRHDLLLVSDRPTLLSFFRSRGYETFGLYPAVTWDWPEREFYGFGHYIDGRALDYRGPAFGYWRIPDQFAYARYEAMHPVRADSPPRFLFFATMNTHAPFRPVPPYQPDWARLLSPMPFDAGVAAQAIAEGNGWHDLVPAYVRALDYMYRWLAGLIERPRKRETLFVLIGDHQPLGNVSGPGASWDVPVHVVAPDGPVLQRLVEQGFQPGLVPRGAALGGMHRLAPMLLRAFDGGTSPAVAAAPTPVGTAGEIR